MKKCLSIFSVVIFFPLVLGVTSCKKNHGAATPSEDILGTWQQTEYAYDNNNTGTITPSEIFPQPSSFIKRVTFNSDGTGVENDIQYSVAKTPLNFIWTISAADELWVAYTNNDTISYFLKSITSSTLVLTTVGPIGPGNSVSVLQWYQYSK